MMKSFQTRVGRLLVGVSALFALSAGSNLRAANVTVTTPGFSFSPKTVTINVGDTVTWVTQTFAGHDVEADDGTFKSGPPGSFSTFSFTFTEAKTITYRCNPHAAIGMRGTVIVQAAQNQPPTVNITAPGNGAVFTTADLITISANASDDVSVASVEFFDGGISLGVDTSAPYSISKNLAAGQHTLTAKATDNANLSTTSAGVNITVNAANQAPTVNLTSPANGATFNTTDTITISADATDSDGISQVEFLDGANSLGIDTSAPYSISINLAAGPHSITARATDNLSASATSTPVNITVNAVADNPPTVSITSPGNSAFVAPANVKIDASAEDPGGTVTKVEFFDGLTSIGVVTTAPYSITPTLQAGHHTITAVATDNANQNATSGVVTINVAVPPTLTITRVSATEYKLSATGTAAVPHIIQGSTNLTSWTDITTITPTRGGAINFTDTVAADLPFKFYRIIVR
jgi:plastocyanin